MLFRSRSLFPRFVRRNTTKLDTEKAKQILRTTQLFEGASKVHHTDFYFPRPRHENLLLDLLEHEPQGIIPVIGVPNVGKTTLLRTILKDKVTANIDLRKQGVISSVDQFIRILQNQFLSWDSTTIEGIERVKNLIGSGSILGFKFEIPKDKAVMDFIDFNKLLRAVDDTLQTIKKSGLGIYPVLFLDDANKLRYLLRTEEGSRVLHAFFDWCVSSSKADKLLHVVIASSSGLFVRWLQAEFGLTSHLRTVVIGDIDIHRATRFLTDSIANLRAERDAKKQITRIPSDKELNAKHQQALFSHVVSSLGCSLYHLRLFSQDYVAGIPCEVILGSIRASVVRDIIGALKPGQIAQKAGCDPVQWTTGEWLRTLRLIVQSKGEIPFDTLVGKVFPRHLAGIESLISYDLLWYRPTHSRSIEKEDITKTALSSHLPLIRAPTVPFFEGMKVVLENLPTPIIVIDVGLASKKGGPPRSYRQVNIDGKDFSFLGLNQLIYQRFQIPTDERISIVLEPDIEVYRSEDLDLLTSSSRLVVRKLGKRKLKKDKIK